MGDLSRAADIALDSINKTLLAVTKLQIVDSTRNTLAVTLMRASMDHARAAVLLISMHPDELGLAAIALHRSQIDTLFRGAFFAKNATDDEVEYFIGNDEMPNRPDHKGSPKRLSPRDLVPWVGDVLSVGKSTKLVGYVDKSWKTLCGMVHGGMQTVAIYNNAQIGFQLAPEDLVEIVGNALALTQLAMIGMSTLSKLEKQQLGDIFQEPHQAQNAFYEYVQVKC